MTAPRSLFGAAILTLALAGTALAQAGVSLTPVEGEDDGIQSLEELLGLETGVEYYPPVEAAWLGCLGVVRSGLGFDARGLGGQERTIAPPDQRLSDHIGRVGMSTKASQPDSHPVRPPLPPAPGADVSHETLRHMLSPLGDWVEQELAHLIRVDRQVARMFGAQISLEGASENMPSLHDVVAPDAGLDWPYADLSYMWLHRPEACDHYLIRTEVEAMLAPVDTIAAPLAVFGLLNDYLLLADTINDVVRPRIVEDELLTNLCTQDIPEFWALSDGDEGTICPARETRVYWPYFSGVEAEIENDLATGAVAKDVQVLETAINDALSIVADAKARHALGQFDDARTLSPLLERLTALLGLERDRLTQFRADLDREIVALVDLQGDIDEAKIQASTMVAELAASATWIGDLERALAALDLKRETLRSLVANRRAAIATAREELDAIELLCGGASIENCTSVAAKEAYNRSRYEAYQALDVLLSDFLDAQDDVLSTDAEYFSSRVALGETISRRASVQVNHSSLVTDIAVKVDEHALRTAVLAGEEARYTVLWPNHEADFAVATETRNVVDRVVASSEQEGAGGQ